MGTAPYAGNCYMCVVWCVCETVERQGLYAFCDAVCRIFVFVRHDVVEQAVGCGVGLGAVEIEEFVCESAVVVRPKVRFRVFCWIAHVAADGA